MSLKIDLLDSSGLSAMSTSHRVSFRLVLFLLGVALVGGPRLTAQELLPSIDFPASPSPAEVVVPPAADKPGSPFLDSDDRGETPATLPPRGNPQGALNQLFSHQWLKTSPDGTLRGSVVTLVGEDTLSVSGAHVLLAQHGKVVADVQSDASGQFTIDGVAPGYYSIVAEADNSFATYGLAVLDGVAGNHLPSHLEMRVVRPKGETIRQLLNTEMIPGGLSYTLEQVVQDPISNKRVFAKSHRVLANQDGTVVGRLSRLGVDPQSIDLSQMTAIVLRDGVEVGRSPVSVDGQFRFAAMEPGCYGFMAAGNQGVAAVAFCVIKSDALARRTADGKVLVLANNQDVAVSSLNVELADGVDVMNVQQTTDEVFAEEAIGEDCGCDPLMPIGANMFGAGQVIGGGGGGGFGSLLTDIAGLGALGVIAAIVADELDDDDDVVSPVVTR